MQANKNLCHPRIVENLPNGDKNFTKFPICYPTGSFFSLGYESLKKKILGGDRYEEDDYNQFDQLGLGITMYFKIIKSLIMVLILATILSLPYMTVFTHGELAASANGMDKTYGQYSLGNIGHNNPLRCISQDVMACNTVDIVCPKHHKIEQLQ